MRRFAGLVLVFCLIPAIAEAAGTCTASSTAVAFGVFNPFGSNTASTGTVSVTCSGGSASSPYTIALSTGSGTYAQRLMQSGANTLNYNLYTSSAYTTVWGDGTGVTATVAGTNGHTTSNFTVYGQLLAPQGVAPGSYSDTITVTVTY